MPSSFFDLVDKLVVVVVVEVVVGVVVLVDVVVEEMGVVSSISLAAESRQSQDQM